MIDRKQAFEGEDPTETSNGFGNNYTSPFTTSTDVRKLKMREDAEWPHKGCFVPILARNGLLKTEISKQN